MADSKYTVPSGATDTLGIPGAKTETSVARVRSVRPVREETTTNRDVAVHPTIWSGLVTGSAARGTAVLPGVRGLGRAAGGVRHHTVATVATAATIASNAHATRRRCRRRLASRKSAWAASPDSSGNPDGSGGSGGSPRGAASVDVLPGRRIVTRSVSAMAPQNYYG